MLALLPIATKLLDKFIPDPIKANEAKAALLSAENAAFFKELELQAGVVLGETKSEHFIVAAWRPITMLSFVAVIVNNHILYPYLSLFWTDAPILTIPPDMYNLLELGITGYVFLRSGEKIVKEYRK
jgi:hypothetical protein|tara:strand:- start:283 stop:663 length:381 start_codon:yes stop_codon:yes gene_type:complete